MARAQETFSKKENEKKRLKKKNDKEEKRELRLASAKKGQSLDEMLAYVDENGNISSTPPDPTKKRVIKTEDIRIRIARQEDLPQEKADNEQDPDRKKAALETIIADYNARYSTNHSINEFDLYYQDVQKRIKDQQYPNQDIKHALKIDLLIVVDMLLTGFDSKYLNTLY